MMKGWHGPLKDGKKVVDHRNEAETGRREGTADFRTYITLLCTNRDAK